MTGIPLPEKYFPITNLHQINYFDFISICLVPSLALPYTHILSQSDSLLLTGSSHLHFNLKLHTTSDYIATFEIFGRYFKGNLKSYKVFAKEHQQIISTSARM